MQNKIGTYLNQLLYNIIIIYICIAYYEMQNNNLRNV